MKFVDPVTLCYRWDVLAPVKQFVPFLIAGGLSVIVNVGSRILLSTIISYELAVAISHVLGMITAFLLNKIFVFSPSGRCLHSEFSRFALVNVFSLTQTWIVSVGLVRLVFPVAGFDFHPELTAHIIALGLSPFTSFWGHKRYSFAQSKDLSESSQALA
jgi:putative flippase GtrA